jgi:maltose alpha-D-glucosyltransferase/alpha-amylase
LPEEIREEAASLLQMERSIADRQKAFLTRKLSAMKIRHHGDYHLGQVLYTGKDFVIIDFEGEPARTLGERRLKKSPLRDVAGMIRSFHYAAYLSLLKEAPTIRPEDKPVLEPWADVWYYYISGAFLKSYLEVAGSVQDLIPKDVEELETMLKSYLLDKAIYELGYELNNRPDWVMIPIRGIHHILEEG